MARKYVLKAEVALRQVIDEVDNEAWEKTHQDNRDDFLMDMKRDIELSMREKMGEHGEVHANVWMELSEDDSD
jgi:hypothetical protein